MRPIALVAAAIGAVLLTRRKSLKDDANRVKSAASESARRSRSCEGNGRFVRVSVMPASGRVVLGR